MYIATSYETDTGNLLTYAVAIYIGNDELLYQPEQIVGNPLIPSVLLSSLVWFPRNPCPTTQIVARYVKLFLLSGVILKIAYPFRPGTSNWLTFWQQLQSPEIIYVEGMGEMSSSKYLRKSLGM